MTMSRFQTLLLREWPGSFNAANVADRIANRFGEIYR